MPVCTHCGTFTSEERQDPSSAVFPCRRCGEDLNGSGEEAPRTRRRPVEEDKEAPRTRRRPVVEDEEVPRTRRRAVVEDEEAPRTRKRAVVVEEEAPRTRRPAVVEDEEAFHEEKQATPRRKRPYYCPECGEQIHPEDEICEECGAELQVAQPVRRKRPPTQSPPIPQGEYGTNACPDCGFEMLDEEEICLECGYWLQAPSNEKVNEYDRDNSSDTSAQQSSSYYEEQKKNGNVIVTTGDINVPYEILGPVYFQVSNKGLFGSALSSYVKRYALEIQSLKQEGTMSAERVDWGCLYGEWSVGQSDFEKAFFVATEELKKRAKMVGGDAVICMRQDIDMDTNGFAYFYLQMYGTAVRLV